MKTVFNSIFLITLSFFSTLLQAEAFLSLTGFPDVSLTIDTGLPADKMDITAYGVAASRSCIVNPSTGIDCGNTAAFGEIEIIKFNDKNTGLFFEKLTQGDVILDGCLITAQNSGSGLQKTSGIGLQNIAVTSLTPNSDGTLSVSLNYQKISVISYNVDPQTGAPASTTQFCWDRVANVACSVQPLTLSCPPQ